MYAEREFDFGAIGNRLELYHIANGIRRALNLVAADLDEEGVSRDTIGTVTESLHELLTHVDALPPTSTPPPERVGLTFGDSALHPEQHAPSDVLRPPLGGFDYWQSQPSATLSGPPTEVDLAEFIWAVQELLSITEGTFAVGVTKCPDGFKMWFATTPDVLRFDTDVPVVVSAYHEVATNAECEMYLDSVRWAQQQAEQTFPTLLSNLDAEVPPWSPFFSVDWPSQYTAEYEQGGFIFRISRSDGTLAFGLDRTTDAVTPLRRQVQR